MTVATATSPAPVDAPRAELARLCRQICLLRENAAPAPESSLDQELAEALATVRSLHGADSVHEEDLLDLFRAEQLRVTDAAILAELLAPKLTAYFRAHGLSATPFPPNEPWPTPASSASIPAPSRPSPSASPPPPAAPAGPPGIADLLDGMLEQDRHDERTRRPGARR